MMVPGMLQLRHVVSMNCAMKTSGHGCSKLTTSLVNVSLKFQTLISNIRQYFLLKKIEKLFQTNISEFSNKIVKIHKMTS